VICQNCEGPDGRAVSYDLDLPTVVLCGICSLLLVTNPAMFDEVRGKQLRVQPVSTPRETT
jgi:hypothetical protein